jgi:hypothetical protein
MKNNTVRGLDLFEEHNVHVFDEKNNLVGIAMLENGQWFARSANGKTKVPCGSKETAIEELNRQAVLSDRKIEKRDTDQLQLF